MLTCNVRVIGIDFPLGDPNGATIDCATVDYEALTSLDTRLMTTGNVSVSILNHCSTQFVPPDAVPEFVLTGENFDCDNWTVEDGPGSLLYGIPTEEPSSLLTGDGSQIGRYDD